MRPSLGFGGSCLPKELQVLASAGRRRGLPMHVARAIGQVNVEQQDRFVRRILGELPEEGAGVGLATEQGPWSKHGGGAGQSGDSGGEVAAADGHGPGKVGRPPRTGKTAGTG